MIQSYEYDPVKHTLRMSYPPHVFTASEYDLTLQQLGLVPNATLLITVHFLSINNSFQPFSWVSL
jgi:hypothetical protein